jgi:DNA-binding YbaB/EbfC family protein
MGMFDMLRQAHTMKEKMKNFQEELERQTFEASAGNGAVTVVMNGKHEVKKVVLDPKILPSVDSGRLEGLIQEAMNEAGRQVKEKLKSEVSKMTGGLDIPGLF